jgi:hypothetical protein
VRNQIASFGKLALIIQVSLLEQNALPQVLDQVLLNMLHQVDLLLHNILSDINTIIDIIIETKMEKQLHHLQTALELKENNQELIARNFLK